MAAQRPEAWGEASGHHPISQFRVLVVGGFLALTLLEGGGEETQDQCETAAAIETAAG